MIENLALRQQVTALKKERPRPPLEDTDRVFWVALRASWPGWACRLLVVNADTVARWNRDRFPRYWAKISQRRHPARPCVDAEIRRLVRTMAQDGWGAPRIPHGAHEAWIPSLGNDGVALPAVPAYRTRSGETLGRFLAQPQGRNRRDGFVHFHSADGVAPAPVRLPRHRARPSTHRALLLTLRRKANSYTFISVHMRTDFDEAHHSWVSPRMNRLEKMGVRRFLVAR